MSESKPLTVGDERARYVRAFVMLEQAMTFAPGAEVASILLCVHCEVAASGIGLADSILSRLNQTGWFADDGMIRPEIARL